MTRVVDQGTAEEQEATRQEKDKMQSGERQLLVVFVCGCEVSRAVQYEPHSFGVIVFLIRRLPQ